MRHHLTYQECAARYPLLVRAMKWVAILTDGEAACAIRDYRDGYQGPEFGSEAVCHYGGPRAVIEAAWRGRHWVSEVHRHHHGGVYVYDCPHCNPAENHTH
jgi:hypothetical protein